MKKTLTASALVALVAVAGPTTASAGWSPAGTQTAEGALSVTWDANGITTQCYDVAADVSLDAAGYGGKISEFSLNSCSVTTPGFAACIVDPTPTASPSYPWGLLGNPLEPSIAINGIGTLIVYTGGASCPLNGLVWSFGGAVEGQYDNASSTLSFSAAPGLVSSQVGTVTLDGELAISNGVQLT